MSHECFFRDSMTSIGHCRFLVGKEGIKKWSTCAKRARNQSQNRCAQCVYNKKLLKEFAELERRLIGNNPFFCIRDRFEYYVPSQGSVSLFHRCQTRPDHCFWRHQGCGKMCRTDKPQISAGQWWSSGFHRLLCRSVQCSSWSKRGAWSSGGLVIPNEPKTINQLRSRTNTSLELYFMACICFSSTVLPGMSEY